MHKSICGQPLLFPILKTIQLENCRELEKLPFELNSVTCLETLFLKECTEMVDILALQESLVTSMDRQLDYIFSSLRTITLENMQNLKSICGQPLLITCLKRVVGINCPKLEKPPFELDRATCFENFVVKECTKMVDILPFEASEMTNDTLFTLA